MVWMPLPKTCGNVLRHSGQVIMTYSSPEESCPWNPDRRQRVGKTADASSWSWSLQFAIRNPRRYLFHKSIGGHPWRYTVAGKRAAHGNQLDRGKSSSHHGEQFEAGHPGHIEVR